MFALKLGTINFKNTSIKSCRMKSCSSRGKFNSVRKKVRVRKTVEPLLCTVNLCTKFLFGGNRDSDRNLCCETDAAIPIESYDIFTLQGEETGPGTGTEWKI